MVGVASIGTSWVTMPRVAIGAATGVVSWVAAGVAWHLAAGGTTGLAVGGFRCLSLAGMYVVRSSLNLDASRHIVFPSLTLLAWIVDPITFVAMWMYGSNGVSPLRFLSRFRRTASPALKLCSLALCLWSW